MHDDKRSTCLCLPMLGCTLSDIVIIYLSWYAIYIGIIKCIMRLSTLWYHSIAPVIFHSGCTWQTLKSYCIKVFIKAMNVQEQVVIIGFEIGNRLILIEQSCFRAWRGTQIMCWQPHEPFGDRLKCNKEKKGFSLRKKIGGHLVTGSMKRGSMWLYILVTYFQGVPPPRFQGWGFSLVCLTFIQAMCQGFGVWYILFRVGFHYTDTMHPICKNVIYFGQFC